MSWVPIEWQNNADTIVNYRTHWPLKRDKKIDWTAPIKTTLFLFFLIASLLLAEFKEITNRFEKTFCWVSNERGRLRWSAAAIVASCCCKVLVQMYSKQRLLSSSFDADNPKPPQPKRKEGIIDHWHWKVPRKPSSDVLSPKQHVAGVKDSKSTHFYNATSKLYP